MGIHLGWSNQNHLDSFSARLPTSAGAGAVGLREWRREPLEGSEARSRRPESGYD